MYYWTALNKATGEIAEQGRGYSTKRGALRAAKNFIDDSWEGTGQVVLVEIWTVPSAYSDKIEFGPLIRREYRTGTVDIWKLVELSRLLDASEEECEELSRWNFEERKFRRADE